MKDMSTQTRIFVLTTIVVGTIVFINDFISLHLAHSWVMGLFLIIVASLSLVFKVEGTTSTTHYNFSFLVYSFTLFYLGLPWALLVMVVSNLIDWIKHKYPWYIQCFNIAAFSVTFHIAYEVYSLIEIGTLDFDLDTGLAIIAGVLTFTIVNHMFIGLVIWFARGENFAESGVFDFLPVMIDFTLMGLGAVSALVYDNVPLLIPLLVAPLYLVQHTLRVPALERGVVQDPKTKLFNSEYLMHAIDKELERAERFDRPMTIVIGDMDLLRNVNNNYGHIAGDMALLTVATTISENVRESDVVARYGGEEFVILMPETTTDEAYSRIEEIRDRISAAPIEISSSVTPIFVTMSFGIAQRERHGQTKEEIIHNADLALYHSKLKGRNRTFIYSDESFDEFYMTKDAGGMNTKELKMPEPAGSQMVMSMREHAELQKVEKEQHPKKGKKATKATTQAEKKPAPELNMMPLIVGTKGQPPAWYSNLFIGVLFIVSIGMVSFMGVKFSLPPFFDLAMFAVIVFLTEYMSLEIYVRETAVSTSAAPLLAGAMLFGPLGSLVLGFTLAFAAWFKHHAPFSRVVFNFANQLFATSIVLMFFKFSGREFQVLAQSGQLFVSLVGALVLYILTTAMISVGIWLSRGTNVFEVWNAQFKWLAIYYLVFGAFSYTLAFGYLSFDVLGLLFIVTPLFLLRISQKQYIDHTKKSVDTLRNQNLELQRQAEEINQLNEELLNVFAYLLDLRDPFVLGHSQQVAHYCVSIGKEIGLPPKRIENLRKAAILHDIGKLAISDTILTKPDKLTPEEMQVIRNHVILGGNLINRCPSIKHLAPIVNSHHEQYGGNGYPQGLKANQIPMEARILGLADAVEAMSSDRPYRAALTYDQIIAEVIRCRGTQFDPEVVDAFMALVEKKGDSFLVNSATFIQPEIQGNIRVT